MLLDPNLLDMEDQHTLILSLKEDKDAAFFAVFDGHGGMFNSSFIFISFLDATVPGEPGKSSDSLKFIGPRVFLRSE